MALDWGKTAAALLTLSLGCSTGAAWSADQLPDAHVETKIPRFGTMAVGFESVWVMSHDSLARIRIIDTSVIEIPIAGAFGRSAYGDTAVGEGAVWVPDANHGAVYKIDPVSNRVAMQVEVILAEKAESLGVGEGSVWAVSGGGDVLKRFAAADGAEQAAIALPSNGYGVLVAHGAVWVTRHRGVAPAQGLPAIRTGAANLRGLRGADREPC